ncbi:MAG: M50 family metallopeptidase [Chloroflexota bacterium]
MTTLYFIAAIAFLILIHELGHFAAAKLVGIPIQEFGIGFPPRALTLFTYKGTKFTLNWIPLGGFVRPKERPGDEEIPDELFAAAPWKRIFVYLAGPAMNLLAAVVILATLTYQSGSDLEHIIVTDVVPGTPAAAAEMLPGDYILAVNDIEVINGNDLTQEISQNKGIETKLTLLRDETELTVWLVPRAEHPIDEGPMGIGLIEPATILNSITGSVELIGYQVKSIASTSVRFVGFKGMYDTFDTAVEMDEVQQDIPDGANTWMFVVMVSISLGLINLVPIPLFDGGKILLAIPEMITRKRVPINFHYVMNMIGLVLVVVLMVYVNVQDFINPVELLPPAP